MLFHVKGSSADAYEVTFIKDGDSLTALCTCPAGQFGGLCKHRVALIDGKSDAVTSDNADQVAKIVEWADGTDVAVALAILRDGENNKNLSKEEIKVLKKNVARAMNT